MPYKIYYETWTTWLTLQETDELGNTPVLHFVVEWANLIYIFNDKLNKKQQRPNYFWNYSEQYIMPDGRVDERNIDVERWQFNCDSHVVEKPNWSVKM